MAADDKKSVDYSFPSAHELRDRLRTKEVETFVTVNDLSKALNQFKDGLTKLDRRTTISISLGDCGRYCCDPLSCDRVHYVCFGVINPMTGFCVRGRTPLALLEDWNTRILPELRKMGFVVTNETSRSWIVSLF